MKNLFKRFLSTLKRHFLIKIDKVSEKDFYTLLNLHHKRANFIAKILRKRDDLKRTRNTYNIIFIIAIFISLFALSVSVYTTYLSVKISLFMFYLVVTFLLFFYCYNCISTSKLTLFCNCLSFVKDIDSYLKNNQKNDLEEFIDYMDKRRKFYLNDREGIYLTVVALIIVITFVLYLLLAIGLLFPPKSSENNLVNLLVGLAAIATLEPVIEDRILKPLLVEPYERAINKMYDEYSYLIKKQYRK